MIAARRNACDDSRRNMFHKYVCCIEYSPPAITLQCQCSPRRAPHEFSISISLCMTLSNKCSCIRSRHEDKIPVCFYKGAGWPSRGALRIALKENVLAARRNAPLCFLFLASYLLYQGASGKLCTTDRLSSTVDKKTTQS